MDADALEREWRHAAAIALLSIGQPDRARNVAYRDELEAKLHAALAEADCPCPGPPIVLDPHCPIHGLGPREEADA